MVSWKDRQFFGFYYTSDRMIGKDIARGSGYCLCGWGARIRGFDLRIDFCPRRRWHLPDPDEPYFLDDPYLPKYLTVYWQYRLVFSL